MRKTVWQHIWEGVLQCVAAKFLPALSQPKTHTFNRQVNGPANMSSYALDCMINYLAKIFHFHEFRFRFIQQLLTVVNAIWRNIEAHLMTETSKGLHPSLLKRTWGGKILKPTTISVQRGQVCFTGRKLETVAWKVQISLENIKKYFSAEHLRLKCDFGWWSKVSKLKIVGSYY